MVDTGLLVPCALGEIRLSERRGYKVSLLLAAIPSAQCGNSSFASVDQEL